LDSEVHLFAFWCKYEDLNIFGGEDATKERWELWNKDIAEVFLNPQPERLWHYYEFEVAPNNQWIDLEITGKGISDHDAKWNSNFGHAAQVDSKNHVWTAEMRIPLSALNVSDPKPESNGARTSIARPDWAMMRNANFLPGTWLRKAGRFTHRTTSESCV